MKTLIFSKHRACQLDLLLTSLQHFDHEEVLEPIVLWKAGCNYFGDAYNQLIKEHKECELWCQADFKSEVIAYLKQCDDYCMFLVDDQFMRYPMLFDWEEVDSLFEDKNICTLSLRLGENTTWQYQLGVEVPLPKFSRRGPFLVWNHHAQSSDVNWGYPMSVDAHIFRTRDMLNWVRPLTFNNPNQFEAALSMLKGQVPSLMACQEESVFVNNVLNVVQDEYQNKHGDITAQDLNDMYLSGLRFNLMSMTEYHVNAAHQEMKVKMQP